MQSMRPCWIWVLGLFVATAGAAQEPATRPLQPAGVYSAIRSTQDHTYGQRMRFWYRGSLLVGEVLYWDGNLEAQFGRFSDGHINIRTGEVRFKVTLVRRDLQPRTYKDATFEGLLVKGVLSGKWQWQGEAVVNRGPDGIEHWRLRYDKSEVLGSYASVAAWETARAE